MSIDMTKLVTDAAEKWWAESRPYGTPPLSEQSMLVQHSVKAQVLPVVVSIKPVVETHAEDAALRAVKHILDDGHQRGYTSDEILLNLQLSLMQ